MSIDLFMHGLVIFMAVGAVWHGGQMIMGMFKVRPGQSEVDEAEAKAVKSQQKRDRLVNSINESLARIERIKLAVAELESLSALDATKHAEWNLDSLSGTDTKDLAKRQISQYLFEEAALKEKIILLKIKNEKVSAKCQKRWKKLEELRDKYQIYPPIHFELP